MNNLIFPILQSSILQPQDWVEDFFTNFYDFPDLENASPDNLFRIREFSSLLKTKDAAIGCFVGAGISIPYGMPTWSKFLDEAAIQMDAVELVAEAIKSGDFPQVAQLLENQNKDKFEDIILNKFSHSNIEPKLLGAGALLPFLPFQYLVTTNFDYVIEGIYQVAGRSLKPVIYGANPKIASLAKKEGLLPLLKIHGDYLDEERILTTNQYKKSYGKESPLFNHLIELFSSISFIFIGFSFQDKEIKEALRQAKIKNPSNQHFVILQTKPQEELELWELEFLELGVLAIWYEGSHSQVNKLLGLFTTIYRPDLELIKLGLAFKYDTECESALPLCEKLLKERPNCHASKKAFSYMLANSIDLLMIYDINYVHEAIGKIDRAIGMFNNFPDAYLLRGFLNIYRFNIDWAMKDFTLAIEGGGSIKEQARAMRGMYLMTFKWDMEGAREDFATAINNLPSEQEDLINYLKFYLAFIEIKLGDSSAFGRLKDVIYTSTLEADTSTNKQMKFILPGAEWLNNKGLLRGLLNTKTSKFEKWLFRSFFAFYFWLGRAGLLQRLYRPKKIKQKKLENK